MEYDIITIDELTKLKVPNRAALWRWIARQGESTIIEAFKLQGKLIRQNLGVRSPEYFYSMLTQAFDKMAFLESSQSQKSALSLDEARKMTEIRIDRQRAKKKSKAAIKRQTVKVRFYYEVKMLREKGLSWRDISDYLKANRRTRISYSYLRECFTEMERKGGVK